MASRDEHRKPSLTALSSDEADQEPAPEILRPRRMAESDLREPHGRAVAHLPAGRRDLDDAPLLVAQIEVDRAVGFRQADVDGLGGALSRVVSGPGREDNVNDLRWASIGFDRLLAPELTPAAGGTV
jgi:hypothetical protein